MSVNLIKHVFSIIGTLLVSIILYTMIFTVTGQQFLWRAIEPFLLDEWNQCTMDNGAARTVIYEDMFSDMKYNHEYERIPGL